jgi:hypothetical protein
LKRCHVTGRLKLCSLLADLRDETASIAGEGEKAVSRSDQETPDKACREFLGKLDKCRRLLEEAEDHLGRATIASRPVFHLDLTAFIEREKRAVAEFQKKVA